MLVVMLGLFAGCGDNGTNAGGEGDNGRTLKVVGSTSVGPLMEKFVEAYEQKTASKVDIEQVGSSAGIQAVINGSGDIGMSSRDIAEDELSQGLEEHIIALDGIAVIVGKQNQISDLTTQQIKDIFTGKITNWKDVGGTDSDIIVVSRESGSGTRSAFEELVGVDEGENGSGLVPTALTSEGTGAVKSNIATKPNAIGYISTGYIDDTVKTLQINGVEPTIDNIKAKTYTLSRPFVLVTKGEPDSVENEFLNWILGTEGQAIVDENKYITVE